MYSVNKDTSPCCGGIVLYCVRFKLVGKASKISDSPKMPSRGRLEPYLGQSMAAVSKMIKQTKAMAYIGGLHKSEAFQDGPIDAPPSICVALEAPVVAIRPACRRPREVPHWLSRQGRWAWSRDLRTSEPIQILMRRTTSKNTKRNHSSTISTRRLRPTQLTQYKRDNHLPVAFAPNQPPQPIAGIIYLHLCLHHTFAMSLVNLAHVCSHLQNASKARLGLTSIPVSKLHVNLALGLQREGFLSSVTLGGTTPPKPFLLQAQHDPEQLEKMAEKLKEEPWHAYPVEVETEKGVKNLTEKVLGKELLHEVHVPENPARRRLWLGLKYWQNQPVLNHMKLVSKPTRRIWLTSEDLGRITRTRASSYVQGLTHPGECMFVTTDRGILEARECVERRVGGMALCRVW